MERPEMSEPAAPLPQPVYRHLPAYSARTSTPETCGDPDAAQTYAGIRRCSHDRFLYKIQAR